MAALPLASIRILSLALNLPGPAALMRCRRMGATCTKLEPPAGDPMRHYNPGAYTELHEGITVRTVDLKTDAGQAAVHEELARTAAVEPRRTSRSLRCGRTSSRSSDRSWRSTPTRG